MTTPRGPGRGNLRPLRRDGRTVYLGDWIDGSGERHRKILSDDRTTAQRILNTLVRRRDLERVGMGAELGLDRPFRELAKAYLEDLARRNKRPHTIATYRRALERLAREIPAETVRDVTRGRVLSWRDGRVDGGASNKTANTEVGALRAALAFALERELLGINPLAGLRDLPATRENMRRPPRALSDDEVSRLLAACRAHDDDRRWRVTPRRLPRYPLVVALISTGARWNELIQTTWSDLDLEHSTLTLREETTKTQRARTIPLGSDLCSLIESQRAAQTARSGIQPNPLARIFLTPDGRPWPQNTGKFLRWLVARFDQAGIPKRDELGRVVHVHSLRHTFATRCARAGIPLQVTQRLLGHATSRMTLETYSHVQAEDVKKAIDLLPGLP